MWCKRLVSSGLTLRASLSVTILLLVVSLAFLIAGYVTPGWLGYGWDQYDDGRRVWVGLWYARVCTGPLATVCQTVSLSEPDTLLHCYEITRNMTQFQVETTLALLAGITALVLTVDIFRSNSLQRPFVNAIGPLCLVAGILSLTAGGTMSDAAKKGARLFKVSDCGNPYKVPYSAILTCVGGAVIIATALVFMCSKRNNCLKEPGVKQRALA